MPIKVKQLTKIDVNEVKLANKKEEAINNAYIQSIKTAEKKQAIDRPADKQVLLITKKENPVIYKKKTPWNINIECLRKVKQIAKKTNMTQEKLIEWLINHLEYTNE